MSSRKSNDIGHCQFLYWLVNFTTLSCFPSFQLHTIFVLPFGWRFDRCRSNEKFHLSRCRLYSSVLSPGESPVFEQTTSIQLGQWARRQKVIARTARLGGNVETKKRVGRRRVNFPAGVTKDFHSPLPPPCLTKMGEKLQRKKLVKPPQRKNKKSSPSEREDRTFESISTARRGTGKNIHYSFLSWLCAQFTDSYIYTMVGKDLEAEGITLSQERHLTRPNVLPLSEQQQDAMMMKKLPKEIRNIVAGGIAGMVAKSFVAPFDRIKILYQISSTRFRISDVPIAAMNIVKEEGISALWKGNSATMIRVFPYSGIQFMVYDRCKMMLLKEQEMEYLRRKAIDPKTPKPRWGLTPKESLCSGMIAGVISVIFTYPLDMTRAQLAVLRRQKDGSSTMSFLQVITNNYRNRVRTNYYPTHTLVWYTLFGSMY